MTGNLQLVHFGQHQNYFSSIAPLSRSGLSRSHHFCVPCADQKNRENARPSVCWAHKKQKDRKTRRQKRANLHSLGVDDSSCWSGSNVEDMKTPIPDKPKVGGSGNCELVLKKRTPLHLLRERPWPRRNTKGNERLVNIERVLMSSLLPACQRRVAPLVRTELKERCEKNKTYSVSVVAGGAMFCEHDGCGGWFLGRLMRRKLFQRFFL